MTAYAYGDGRGAGKRIGVARAASIAGPMLALLAVGPLCVTVGPHQMFVHLRPAELRRVPIAFLLPPMRAEPKDDAPAEKRWTPTPLNILFFGLAFAADGVLGTTISVLLSELHVDVAGDHRRRPDHGASATSSASRWPSSAARSPIASARSGC